MLVKLLLEKYKMKKPITKAAFPNVVNMKCMDHLSKILRRAYEYIDLFFGLELKEVDLSGHSNFLVSELKKSTGRHWENDYIFLGVQGDSR